MGEYQLDRLGWFQFERLCQTLLVSAHGLSVQVWGGSKDWGRDAYAAGKLRFPDPEVEQAGPFLFQVKFVSDSREQGGKALNQLKGMIAREAEKIESLLESELWVAPSHYALMTNVRVGSTARSTLLGPVQDLLPQATMHLVDEPQMEAMLNGRPAVRLSFPQVLGLRDLTGLIEEVVNRDQLNRAQALLSDAQELARVFVPTAAHQRSLKTLRQHGFAVLTGPPEMGKTSIARMIALAQAVDGWDVVNCRGPEDFERAFSPERDQIFVADDAFGSTEYKPETAERWGTALAEILPRLGKRHWLVWTSRSEPLRQGLSRLHLQGRAEGFPEPAKVLVDASQLSVQEKTMMLFRHARDAELDELGVALIKQHGVRIVEHDHFTPLRLRRFVRTRAESLASQNASVLNIRLAIRQELAEPTKAMTQSFAALPSASRNLLLSLLDSGPDPSLASLEDSYSRLLKGAPNESVSSIAASLEEHFLRRTQ